MALQVPIHYQLYGIHCAKTAKTVSMTGPRPRPLRSGLEASRPGLKPEDTNSEVRLIEGQLGCHVSSYVSYCGIQVLHFCCLLLFSSIFKKLSLYITNTYSYSTTVSNRSHITPRNNSFGILVLEPKSMARE